MKGWDLCLSSQFLFILDRFYKNKSLKDFYRSSYKFKKIKIFIRILKIFFNHLDLHFLFKCGKFTRKPNGVFKT